jgi:hypothetical protein
MTAEHPLAQTSIVLSGRRHFQPLTGPVSAERTSIGAVDHFADGKIVADRATYSIADAFDGLSYLPAVDV